MSPEHVAWAAGLFEGEGCITHLPDRPHQIRLQLASTDRDVVERFARVVDCGSISYSQRTSTITAHPKPLWIWVAVSNNAVVVLTLLLPYLGERRRTRALQAIGRRTDHIAYATRPRPCSYCKESFSPAWSGAALRQRFCCEEHQRLASHARARAKRRQAKAVA